MPTVIVRTEAIVCPFAILLKMRLVAALLLLFIVIDVTSICTCEDEAFDVGAGTQQVVVLASSSGTGADFTHECFCCCTHIRPERIVHIIIDLPFVDRTTAPQRSGLAEVLTPLHHPPRPIAL